LIRHCSLFRFNPDVSDETKDRILSEFSRLRDSIDAIDSLEIGRNMGDRSDNFDLGVCMSFESFDRYKEYRSHPDHVYFYKNFLIPFQKERASIQFLL
jgi:hypothetical protein